MAAEIESLHDQLYALQVMREEDQREEKWAHSGISKESHETVLQLLKEKVYIYIYIYTSYIYVFI
jgi:hypothetical protein